MEEHIVKEDNGLYEHYSFDVVKGQQPLRIDKYLMNFIENATRNKVQAAAKEGNIASGNINTLLNKVADEAKKIS